MGQEVDTNGNLIPQGPEGGSGLPHDPNPRRFRDTEDGLHNDEVVGGMSSSSGGAPQSEAKGGPIPAVYGGDSQDENTNLQDPKASAPFESGQSASVSIGSASGVEEGNPAL